MQNKIVFLAILTTAILLNVFHTSYVAAFFDYNKFHPVPYRPDLQKLCPRVSENTSSTCIQSKKLYRLTKKNNETNAIKIRILNEINWIDLTY